MRFILALFIISAFPACHSQSPDNSAPVYSFTPDYLASQGQWIYVFSGLQKMDEQTFEVTPRGLSFGNEKKVYVRAASGS